MTLKDLMKEYEQVTSQTLPRRTYTILRVDGRAFHSYLRGAEKPYDMQFVADMDQVAMALCAEIQGTVLGYVQSDEISILMTDFSNPGSQSWFGGNVQKMVSIAAASASVTLSLLRPGTGQPTFDARVFTIPDPDHVISYFMWRQQDAVRNSISMAARAVFSHTRLQGVNSLMALEMLTDLEGIRWDDYPDAVKYGRVIVQEERQELVIWKNPRTQETETSMATRWSWESKAAPEFDREPDGFLMGAVPSMIREGNFR